MASIAIVISRTTKPARGTTPRNATPYRLPQSPLKSPRRQRAASKSTTIVSALSGSSTCLTSYLMGVRLPRGLAIIFAFTVPSGLCAALWHIRTQLLAPRL
jgi:hypothetical protein